MMKNKVCGMTLGGHVETPPEPFQNVLVQEREEELKVWDMQIKLYKQEKASTH